MVYARVVAKGVNTPVMAVAKTDVQVVNTLVLVVAKMPADNLV